MNDSLASTLVLCDLDNLLLGEDGNLTQVVRDVLQLFSSRGGRLTVFSQRSPRAVRSILGSVPRAGAAGAAVSGQQVCAPDLVGRKGHRGSCCPAG